MFARLRSFVRAAAHRTRLEDRMKEEIRFHLEKRIEDLVLAGVERREAERRARLEFGAAGRVEEECREAVGLRWWDAFARNARFAARLMRRDPAFTLAAVLTLGLCIGVNSAVFSVIDAVLLRPLPFPDPQRLVQVVTVYASKGRTGQQEAQTGLVWEAVRDRMPSLDAAVSGSNVVEVNLAGQGRVENVRQDRVSARFFTALGVRPFLGREFSLDEDRRGGPAVVVLSFETWHRVFDADRSIIGRAVLLRGEPHTVVGVMPAGFRSLFPADIWTPVRAWRGGEGGGSNYTVLGRVKAGRSWAQAEAEAVSASAEIFRGMDVPRGAVARLHLVPLQQGLAGDLRRPLLLLWAAVIAVLVIGCSNVASLLLARGSARSREVATRVALGGGRAVVLGQLLTESLVLALAGGAAGLLIGFATVRGLERQVSAALGVWQPIRLDWRVAGVTLFLSAITSLLFGLFPALRVVRVDVRRALVEGGARGVAGGSRHWPRRLLVVTQVSLGLALVVLAGLLVRTVVGLYAQPAGFDARNVIAGRISLQDARYAETASVARLFDLALTRVRALPGVEAAGAALTLPYERALNLGFRPLDARAGEGHVTSVVYVTPGFFRTLRVAVLAGRDFDQRDGPDAPGAAIVNPAFGRFFYKRTNVIGERIDMGREPREIVGIVADVQQRPGWGEFGPMAAVPTIYVPVAQMANGSMSLIHTWFSPSIVVRSSAAPALLIASLQRELRSVDPLLPFTGFRGLDEIRADSLANRRVGAQLLGGLALLALVLTFVGLYGLVASGVAERLHELGIRLALGATRTQALLDVARQGMALALAGTAAGAALAALGVPALRGVVWGVPLFDPWTFIGAGAGVLLLSLLASVLPATKATRLDPATILRAE